MIFELDENERDFILCLRNYKAHNYNKKLKDILFGILEDIIKEIEGD